MKLSTLRNVLRRSESGLFLLERKWPYLLALLSLLFLAVTVVLDSKRPLWNDELFTFYISQQPTLHDVWKTLLTGAEQLPLFFFVVTRMFTALFGANAIALRLPETIGFLVMNICTFLFVRKRVPPAYGLVAFIFPALTTAYYFAYEARPYGVVMGFCGLAMLSWQNAAEGRKRPLSVLGTAIFLACAINSHYYAVLLLIPFGIAELVRYFETRRFDWALYFASAASVVPLVFSLPVIRAASTYSSHFWAKPSWTSIISFYENLVLPTGLALILVAIVSGFAISRRLEEDGFEGTRESWAPAREFALAFGFILQPVVAVCLAKFVTGAFTTRYVITSVIGVTLLLTWSLARIGENRRVLGFVLAGVTVGCWTILAARQYQQFVWNGMTEKMTFKFLSAASSELPVVIASPHQFFVQSRVAAHQGRGHFTYLADVPLALKYTETDTVERGLLALKNYAPLDVQDYRSFIASHPKFLVYGFPDPFGWVLQDSMQSSRQISVKDRNGDSLLYLVDCSSSPAASAGSSR
ncbi:MAG: glycosyltransferase family 39 protein [Bryobacteraceae bacterium]